MELGAFSVSLPVKDLAISVAFYQKLGFQQTGGEGKWAVMANGLTVIGLFEGMFEEMILTFAPGLTQEKNRTDDFTDVRDIQAQLVDQGIDIIEKAKPGDGPAHFVIADPDGNRIMVDQFFPRPNAG